MPWDHKLRRTCLSSCSPLQSKLMNISNQLKHIHTNKSDESFSSATSSSIGMTHLCCIPSAPRRSKTFIQLPLGLVSATSNKTVNPFCLHRRLLFHVTVVFCYLEIHHPNNIKANTGLWLHSKIQLLFNNQLLRHTNTMTTHSRLLTELVLFWDIS